MSCNRILVAATPAQVFDVFTKAHCYANWVVGTKDVRGADPDWPRPGSAFHHTVGLGLARLKDSTQVIDIDQDRRIALEVRVGPAGRAEVVIELEPHGDGTQVTMEERPVHGPAAWFFNPVMDVVLHLRNVEALRRLKRVVERTEAA